MDRSLDIQVKYENGRYKASGKAHSTRQTAWFYGYGKTPLTAVIELIEQVRTEKRRRNLGRKPRRYKVAEGMIYG